MNVRDFTGSILLYPPRKRVGLVVRGTVKGSGGDEVAGEGRGERGKGGFWVVTLTLKSSAVVFSDRRDSQIVSGESIQMR